MVTRNVLCVSQLTANRGSRGFCAIRYAMRIRRLARRWPESHRGNLAAPDVPLRRHGHRGHWVDCLRQYFRIGLQPYTAPRRRRLRTDGRRFILESHAHRQRHQSRRHRRLRQLPGRLHPFRGIELLRHGSAAGPRQLSNRLQPTAVRQCHDVQMNPLDSQGIDQLPGIVDTRIAIRQHHQLSRQRRIRIRGDAIERRLQIRRSSRRSVGRRENQ